MQSLWFKFDREGSDGEEIKRESGKSVCIIKESLDQTIRQDARVLIGFDTVGTTELEKLCHNVQPDSRPGPKATTYPYGV